MPNIISSLQRGLCITLIIATFSLLNICFVFQQPLISHGNDILFDAPLSPPATVSVSGASLTEMKLKTKKKEEIIFINNMDLSINDLFAATWLQNVKNFLLMDADRIRIVEDGNFEAIKIWGRIRKNARMTVNWLDFCVEHLSKWWKILDAPNTKIPSERVVNLLKNYIQNGMTMLDGEDGQPSTVLENTVAIIAFKRYTAKGTNMMDRGKDWGKELTTVSLAATIASLYQAGFGRVVVVGLAPDDITFSQDSFQFLRESLGMINGTKVVEGATTTTNTMIGAMQVGHVHVTNSSWFTSLHNKYNIPRAAIIGLQLALKGGMDAWNRKQWLGPDFQRWKYVYLTEPDTILNTRRENLSQLQEAAERGLVLVPHRLQPIPHESDMKGLHLRTVPDRMIFSALELDSSQEHSCCDAGRNWPGRENKTCTFWWKCGFVKQADSDPLKAHKQLLMYGFIRLKTGTGVVNLAGTENGRRCIPRRSGTCDTTTAME